MLKALLLMLKSSMQLAKFKQCNSRTVPDGAPIGAPSGTPTVCKALGYFSKINKKVDNQHFGRPDGPRTPWRVRLPNMLDVWASSEIILRKTGASYHTAPAFFGRDRELQNAGASKRFGKLFWRIHYQVRALVSSLGAASQNGGASLKSH